MLLVLVEPWGPGGLLELAGPQALPEFHEREGQEQQEQQDNPQGQAELGEQVLVALPGLGGP